MVQLRDTADSIKHLTLVCLMFRKAIWIKHSITYVNRYWGNVFHLGKSTAEIKALFMKPFTIMER